MSEQDMGAQEAVATIHGHYERQATPEVWAEVDALREALKECAKRLRNAIIAGGTDEEYADIAVERYHALLAPPPQGNTQGKANG